MEAHFSWIPLYEETATLLKEWKGKQGELIAFLEEVRANGLVVTPLVDKDAQGTPSLFTEIDPFTFFGTFNRKIREDQRLGIIKAIKERFGVKSPLPSDFWGLPILDNRHSWFIPYLSEREPKDVERLWKIFELALGNDPLSLPEFIPAFDDALQVKGTNVNLTMGLFWIRPSHFISLDHFNRAHLKIKLPPSGLSGRYYVDQLAKIGSSGKPFYEISSDAWRSREQASDGKGTSLPPAPSPELLTNENNYWMVGAYYGGSDPPDQTQRFLDEGIWRNG
jgi:5-methylcytosine-specific restriction protein B